MTRASMATSIGRIARNARRHAIPKIPHSQHAILSCSEKIITNFKGLGGRDAFPCQVSRSSLDINGCLPQLKVFPLHRPPSAFLRPVIGGENERISKRIMVCTVLKGKSSKRGFWKLPQIELDFPTSCNRL